MVAGALRVVPRNPNSAGRHRDTQGTEEQMEACGVKELPKVPHLPQQSCDGDGVQSLSSALSVVGHVHCAAVGHPQSGAALDSECHVPATPGAELEEHSVLCFPHVLSKWCLEVVVLLYSAISHILELLVIVTLLKEC